MMSAPHPASEASTMFACAGCGATQGFRLLYRKNGCAIYRCAQCGVGHADASDFDPAAYYSDGYFSGARADGYGNYLATEPVLRREFARTVAFIRRYRAGGRLLEIGCAYGFFLQEARRHFEVTGIELSPDAAEHARRNGLTVRTGMADAATLADLGRFDAIVLLDVIEHLPHPDETLALCARQLNPGGVIVLTTGDFGSPLARLMGPSWRLMTPPSHLWFFTTAGIAQLAARSGLRLERVEHPWKIVPLSLMMFQAARFANLRPAAPRPAGRIGLPINLFDAMRAVIRNQ